MPSSRSTKRANSARPVRPSQRSQPPRGWRSPGVGSIKPNLPREVIGSTCPARKTSGEPPCPLVAVATVFGCPPLDEGLLGPPSVRRCTLDDADGCHPAYPRPTSPRQLLAARRAPRAGHSERAWAPLRPEELSSERFQNSLGLRVSPDRGFRRFQNSLGLRVSPDGASGRGLVGG